MKTVLSIALLSVTTSAFAVLSAPPKEENISELLEGRRMITSLTEIRNLGLEKGSTKLDVWSGSYWPQFQGSLAVRYNDPLMKPLVEQDYKVQWKAYKAVFDVNPAYSYANTDVLSPAEKYDLLVGDPEMSLTKYSWELGQKNGGETSGKVPTWRGICDGWSSASQMMPRPVKDVVLTDPNGKSIRFFPEDIKALGSLLYARAQVAPVFIGKRCISPIAALCGDTNPAVFHLSLVNRVGALGKSFIADVSPGREVWNYPVKSYEIKYYNVFSDADAPTFEAAMESFDKKKKFRKKESRHADTAYIVGVQLVVNFADMRMPWTTEDKIMSHTYYYDLELNSRLEIVGGEAAGKLPDFIWAPKDTTYPVTWVEKTQGRAQNAVDLVRMSQESAKNGQPLTSVVQRLFEAAK